MASVLNRTNLEYIQSAHTPDYPVEDWVINPDLSPVDGVPKKYWKLTGDVLSEMNTAEKLAVDIAGLASNKDIRSAEVDAKTDSIIAAGFSFDGEQFSLSLESQINWSGLKTLEAILVWPVPISKYSPGDYNLEQADLLSFLGAGATVIQTSVASGRALKTLIAAATTQAELDAVVDNR